MLRHNVAGQALKFTFHFVTFTDFTSRRRTLIRAIMFQTCCRRMRSGALSMLIAISRPHLWCEIFTLNVSRWLPLQITIYSTQWWPENKSLNRLDINAHTIKNTHDLCFWSDLCPKLKNLFLPSMQIEEIYCCRFVLVGLAANKLVDESNVMLLILLHSGDRIEWT